MHTHAAPCSITPHSPHTFSVGRRTVNYYDWTNAHFSAMPTGPFEAPEVAEGGQPRAHEHFDATREIKLKEPLGDPLPVPTYT
jgi:hypothetical protein